MNGSAESVCSTVKNLAWRLWIKKNSFIIYLYKHIARGALERIEGWQFMRHDGCDYHARVSQNLITFPNTHQILPMLTWIIHLLGGLTEEDVSMAVEAEGQYYEERIDEMQETIDRLSELVPKRKVLGRPRKVSIAPVKVA